MCTSRLAIGLKATRLRLAFSIPVAMFPVSHLTRSWRFSQVPRLPLCAHAPLVITDSGGVPCVCHITPGTHTFQHIKTVGFPRHHNGLSVLSIRTTNIRFSELSNAAYAFITPGFIHTLLDMHAGSLQTRWLLSSDGNWTVSSPHPLGNNN